MRLRGSVSQSESKRERERLLGSDSERDCVKERERERERVILRGVKVLSSVASLSQALSSSSSSLLLSADATILINFKS